MNSYMISGTFELFFIWAMRHLKFVIVMVVMYKDQRRILVICGP